MKQKLNRIRQILVALVLITAVVGSSSCEKYSYTPSTVDPNATLSFQNDIQPIFSENCISCHGITKAPDLRDGKSFQSLTKGSYVNLPGTTSKLYVKITGSDHFARSTATDKLKILYWITQGAQNN